MSSSSLSAVKEDKVSWTKNDVCCYICLEKYTVRMRRHHCRLCGRACCHPCSSRKLRLPFIKFFRSQKRVCDLCTVLLLVPQNPLLGAGDVARIRQREDEEALLRKYMQFGSEHFLALLRSPRVSHLALGLGLAEHVLSPAAEGSWREVGGECLRWGAVRALVELFELLQRSPRARSAGGAEEGAETFEVLDDGDDGDDGEGAAAATASHRAGLQQRALSTLLALLHFDAALLRARLFASRALALIEAGAQPAARDDAATPSYRVETRTVTRVGDAEYVETTALDARFLFVPAPATRARCLAALCALPLVFAEPPARLAARFALKAALRHPQSALEAPSEPLAELEARLLALAAAWAEPEPGDFDRDGGRDRRAVGFSELAEAAMRCLLYLPARGDGPSWVPLLADVLDAPPARHCPLLDALDELPRAVGSDARPGAALYPRMPAFSAAPPAAESTSSSSLSSLSSTPNATTPATSSSTTTAMTTSPMGADPSRALLQQLWPRALSLATADVPKASAVRLVSTLLRYLPQLRVNLALGNAVEFVAGQWTRLGFAVEAARVVCALMADKGLVAEAHERRLPALALRWCLDEAQPTAARLEAAMAVALHAQLDQLDVSVRYSLVHALSSADPVTVLVGLPEFPRAVARYALAAKAEHEEKDQEMDEGLRHAVRAEMIAALAVVCAGRSRDAFFAAKLAGGGGGGGAPRDGWEVVCRVVEAGGAALPPETAGAMEEINRAFLVMVGMVRSLRGSASASASAAARWAPLDPTASDPTRAALVALARRAAAAPKEGEKAREILEEFGLGNEELWDQKCVTRDPAAAAAPLGEGGFALAGEKEKDDVFGDF